MNREIKFKAKRKDNSEWVYGYYVKVKHFLGLRYLHYIVDEEQNYTEVIPETVCQYTGLDDKNSVKMFEGDIIKAISTFSCFDKDVIGEVWFKMFDGLELKISDEEMNHFDYLEEIEVIGNIFDNPKLLDKEVK